MGFLKPHLRDVPPLELTITVKRGAPRHRKFFAMPVTVHSDTFKKALQFLIDHNYQFESTAADPFGDDLKTAKKDENSTMAN